MMNGTAPGRRTNRENCSRRRRVARSSGRAWTGSTWASPRDVLTKIGTTTTTATTSRRGSSVVEPNIVVNTGASATIGIAAAALTSGVASSRTIRDAAASSASPTPSTNADDQADQGVPAGHGGGREDRREGGDDLRADRGRRRAAGRPGCRATVDDQLPQQQRTRRRTTTGGQTRPAVAAARPATVSVTVAAGHALPLRSASRTSVTAAKNSADSRTPSQRLAARAVIVGEELPSALASCRLGRARRAPTVDDLGDPPRARRHHHDPVGQHDRLGDRVGDEQDRGAASRARCAAARPASARGSSRPARRTARP